ncbi:bifunctional 5,10-methylenetetrahydrofolate dehydrogenase/5,10-methenyltetrahydrofolate cyclohydrolase [Anaerosphaera multitolerans]|uniref:Bifunctional protein FolD n=1 Tax=Anaerosphaera multitolerans TaxID=2487351 RepID=A0A437S9L5_9FIRM|nr:bifunctional 5,10-methylenetetrahydrofolate dehydrogenase/5,10-methenyltetrahydrofolate cyclohydrolase [Anaerosphaera multitolerans]RVU55507.1 bifunctional 5,10-methylenetetrahydrofolate dehydrogenase/5,10-methenyltetrahydrofolate cyclohydrolase [Anaerosphaera multitolerans]
MTRVLKSEEFAERLKERLKSSVEEKNLNPILSVIRFGENPADLAYERGIKKSAESIGIEVQVNELALDNGEEEVLSLIEELNNREDVGGILIFKPLPEHLDEYRINEAIDPLKDVDCMTSLNKSKVYSGDVTGLIPLAPKAAVLLLEEYGYELKGKNCVIINHSNVVGKPLAMILLDRWATVTICHVETRDLREHTKGADYVFTAMGRAESLDESYFNEDSIIIDIGLSKNAEGKMRGDLDAKSVEGKVKAYSPVPGGVGKMTNLLLLENVINYYLR